MTEFIVPATAEAKLAEIQALVAQVADHEQAIHRLHAAITTILCSVEAEPTPKPVRRKTKTDK